MPTALRRGRSRIDVGKPSEFTLRLRKGHCSCALGRYQYPRFLAFVAPFLAVFDRARQIRRCASKQRRRRPLHYTAFERRHMPERCGTEALIGSMCLLAMRRLTFAPSGEKASYAGSPSEVQACHQP